MFINNYDWQKMNKIKIFCVLLYAGASFTACEKSDSKNQNLYPMWIPPSTEAVWTGKIVPYSKSYNFQGINGTAISCIPSQIVTDDFNPPLPPDTGYEGKCMAVRGSWLELFKVPVDGVAINHIDTTSSPKIYMLFKMTGGYGLPWTAKIIINRNIYTAAIPASSVNLLQTFEYRKLDTNPVTWLKIPMIRYRFDADITTVIRTNDFIIAKDMVSPIQTITNEQILIDLGLPPSTVLDSGLKYFIYPSPY
jgi:hypothetical protein